MARSADRLAVVAVEDRQVGARRPADQVADLVGPGVRAPARNGVGKWAELLPLEEVVHRDRQRQHGNELVRRGVVFQGGRKHPAIQFEMDLHEELSGARPAQLKLAQALDVACGRQAEEAAVFAVEL